MKAIVVAIGMNNEIGMANDMPWGRSLPADLAHFKKTTIGGSIIMGRKTFESIGNKPLKDRENIVVSRTPTGVKGVLTANSLTSAYALARYPVFVCGGSRIYQEAIDSVDILYVTEVQENFPGATVFFPKIDKSIWVEMSRVHHEADEHNDYAYDFVLYNKA
jgi:dihydrofolate reductase